MKSIELPLDQFVFGSQAPSYEHASNIMVSQPSQQDEPVILGESYTPIPVVQEFIPAFPDYTKLSCQELEKEIADLSNILMTSRFSEAVRIAYENALAGAQDQYALSCAIMTIQSPVPSSPTNGGSGEFADDNKSATPTPSTGTTTGSGSAAATTTGGGSTSGTGTGGAANTISKLTSPFNFKSANSYLYAGLGVVAILIIAKMLKKNTNA